MTQNLKNYINVLALLSSFTITTVNADGKRPLEEVIVLVNTSTLESGIMEFEKQTMKGMPVEFGSVNYEGPHIDFNSFYIKIRPPQSAL